jgi:hypothetical protein
MNANKKSKPVVGDVVCPGGTSDCPQGTTCCQLSDGEFGWYELLYKYQIYLERKTKLETKIFFHNFKAVHFLQVIEQIEC